jgi:hydroxypyruvate isomerase
MKNLTRRSLLKASIAGAAATGLPSFASTPGPEPRKRKGRIHQSVCRWCYSKMSIDQLAEYAAKIGLTGVDLLKTDEWEIPRRYGLICTMGLAGGGEIDQALNRTQNHAAIEQALRANIPRAAKAGVPNVITFSGNRAGMPDDEGANNTVIGLNRLKKIAEDNGVNICLELLNSKRDHHDYMCDHTAWGVRVVEEVNSPQVKLLYDIYHMQIMEGDLAETIRQNNRWIGHFHTGGVPGRHELDATQEIHWDFLMRTIADTGFQGYVAHEFLPTADPLDSLRKAVDLCDV